MSNIRFDSSFTRREYTEAVVSNFTDRATLYNAGPKGQMKKQLIENLVTFYPPSYPVLDIACGTGLLGAHLGVGRNVTGVDITDAMLAEARRLCPEGTFIQGHAENLPFDDGVFGSAYICSALVYFTDVPRALKEAHRVLRYGGFLAYQAVTLDSYVAGVVLEQVVRDLLGEERGRYIFELPHGITDKEEANMKLMERAGFADISARRDTVVDQIDIGKLEEWWGEIVCKNGMFRRIAKLRDDELRRIHDLWVERMEERRSIENTVEDRVTSWYVCGTKQS